VGEASLCATPTRNATKDRHRIKGRDYIVDLAWPRLGGQPAELSFETFYGCIHRSLLEKKRGLNIMIYSELLVWTHSAVFWALCKL